MFKKLFIIILLFFLAGYSFGAGSYAKEAVNTSDNLKTAPPTPLKGNTVINLNSDQVEYFQDKDTFVATGNVIIKVEGRDTVIEAKKVTYEHSNDLIIAEKDVKITQRKQVINGDYARFDLASDSALINNPNTELTELKINAKKAKIYPKKGDDSKKDMDILTGDAVIKDPNMSYFFSNSGSKFINNKNLVSGAEPNKTDSKFKPKFKIHSKNIIVNRKKDVDIITLLNSTITINKYAIVKIPTLTLSSDKDTHQVETNLPEIGQLPDLGAYIGYGPVLNLPHGSTLKLVPLFTHGGGYGVGELTRFTSATNRTEMAYSTLKKSVLLHGEQKLFGDTTKIQYGQNFYIDNGILGKQKPNKIIEIVDNRKLFSANNFEFGLRSSAGYIEQDHRWGTARFQQQGDLHNIEPLLNLGKHVGIGASSQYDIAVYGDGDTFGLLRVGPTMTTGIGPLYATAAYYQGGVYGKTPLLVDRYNYGKSNFTFNAAYKLNRYLSLGYIASLNLSKDSWDGKMLQENQVFCWIGPDDLKFRLGYDTKRNSTTFDFNMLLGSDRASLEFDKLKVIEN